MFLKATSRDPIGVNQDFWGYVASAVSVAFGKTLASMMRFLIDFFAVRGG